jgi:predicted phosphodiesterase
MSPLPSVRPAREVDLTHVGRIGVIGDVHCEVTTLRRVLAHFQSLGVEAQLCVGDLVDGPGDANLTFELLEDHGVLAVRGNHDRWLSTGELRELPLATALDDLTPRSRRFLRELPVTRSFRCSRGRLLLCHGISKNDFVGVRPEDSNHFVRELPEIVELLDSEFDYVVSGHTHRAMVRRIDHLTLLNAGTLHRDYRPVCALLDLQAEQFSVFDVLPDDIRLAARWSLSDRLSYLPR